MAADRIDEVPVVIAGAGPAGLVAAITLARNGVGSLLVERNPGLSPLPRATSVSTRTMELWRSWGLEGEIRAGQLDLNSTGGWSGETLAATDGAVVPLGVADLEEVAAVSPTMLAAVPQDHTEPVLLRHLKALGLTEVRFGTELAALGQDAGGVTVVLRQRPGGAVGTVRAGHVVGADGAHSLVRRLLGIPMVGPDHLSELVTVLFEAPLAEVAGDRRHGIYLIQHPQAAGVLVPNGVGDRWLYGREWDPGRERLEDYTDARLAGLIRTAAGAGDLPVRIVAKGAFSFAAQVADRYRAGRAFLVGDAAQRMTPRGGMGMNTAVAEAHDLAWKLAWVHKGWAGPALLDTYEAEWRPIGIRRTTRSAQEGPRPDGIEALAERPQWPSPPCLAPRVGPLLDRGPPGPRPHPPHRPGRPPLDHRHGQPRHFVPADRPHPGPGDRHRPADEGRRRRPGPPRRPGRDPLADRPGRPGRSALELGQDVCGVAVGLHVVPGAFDAALLVEVVVSIDRPAACGSKQQLRRGSGRPRG
jgi:putative polyketide hydroxylase